MGLEVAVPIRDAGVDLIVSAPSYAWSQPVQLKTSRDRAIKVESKYVGRSVLLAFTLLGQSLGPLPPDADGAVDHRAQLLPVLDAARTRLHAELIT